MKIIVSIGFFVFFISSCGKSASNKLESLLTNEGNGKYWDLVHQTNDAKYSIIDSLGGFPYRNFSLYFDKSRIIFYFLYDSSRVIDMNMLNSDIIYSPLYTLNEDTLTFRGKKHLVQRLSSDTLILSAINDASGIKTYKAFNSERLILNSPPSP